jgi:hypothetical protein
MSVEDLIMSFNTDDNPKVGRMVTNPMAWFTRLCKCSTEDKKQDVFRYLKGETKRCLKPMFTQRPGEVTTLSEFRIRHPSFVSHFSFNSVRERASLYLHRVSVFLGRQNVH